MIISIIGIIFEFNLYYVTSTFAAPSINKINEYSSSTLVYTPTVSFSKAMTNKSIIVIVMRPPSLFPNQTDLVNLYKPYLVPNDYVMTYTLRNLNYVDMLPGIKVFGFNTLDEVQKKTPSLKGTGISAIAYDLENGSSARDVNDPIVSVQRASQIAHENGFKFIPIPGYPVNTPLLDGQFAKYADAFIIQAEGHQRIIKNFQNFVTDRVNNIRSTNPNIPIIIEVSVANQYGQVANIQQAYSSVANIVQGVHIWYNPGPEQLARVNQFVEWFQRNYR